VKRKIIIAVCIVIAVLVCGVALSMNRGTIGGADIKEIFTYDTEYKFLKSDKNLIAVNNDGIVAIDKDGKKVWEEITQASDGHAVSEGGYTLFYDKGGYTARVFKDGVKTAQITTDQPILNAKINKNGYFSVISYEIGYKSKIEIFNRQGELVYNWKLGEGYAVDAELSPNGKMVAAIILYTDGGALESCVAIADINREIAVAEHRKKDTLLFSVNYQSNGNIVCVGESETIGYNGRGEEKWSIEYGDKALQHFEVPYSNNIALVFAGGRNNSVVEFYNERGAKKGEYTSDEEIGAIDVNGATYSVAMPRKVVLLSGRGKEKSRFAMQKDIKDVSLLTEKEIAVVSNGVVELVK